MDANESKNLINLNNARGSARNQLRAVGDSIKNPTSLFKYIELGNDWPYAAAFFAAILKDLLDFVGIGSLPAIGTVVTIICSIFIFFMMLLAGGSKKGRAAKALLKGPMGRFMLLGAGTVIEMIFGIDFLPVETLVVVVAYWMLLGERKGSESEREENQDEGETVQEEYNSERPLYLVRKEADDSEEQIKEGNITQSTSPRPVLIYSASRPILDIAKTEQVANAEIKTHSDKAKITNTPNDAPVFNSVKGTRFQDKINKPEAKKEIDDNSYMFRRELGSFEKDLDGLSGKDLTKKEVNELEWKSRKLASSLVYGMNSSTSLAHIDEKQLNEGQWKKWMEDSNLFSDLDDAKKREEANLNEDIDRAFSSDNNEEADRLVGLLSSLDDRYEQLKRKKVNDSRRIGSIEASAYAIGMKEEDINEFLRVQEKLRNIVGNNNSFTKKDFDVSRFRAYWEARKTGDNIFTHVSNSERAEKIIKDRMLRASKATTPEGLSMKQMNSLGQTGNIEENIYFTSGGGGYDYGTKFNENGKPIRRDAKEFVMFAATGNDILASGKSIEVGTPSLTEKNESLRGRALGEYEHANGAEMSMENLKIVIPSSQKDKYYKLLEDNGLGDKKDDMIVEIPDNVIEKAIQEGDGFIRRDDKNIQAYFDKYIKQEVKKRSKNKDKIFATFGGRTSDSVAGSGNSVFNWKQIN